MAEMVGSALSVALNTSIVVGNINCLSLRRVLRLLLAGFLARDFVLNGFCAAVGKDSEGTRKGCGKNAENFPEKSG
jgi:hypothetical protein